MANTDPVSGLYASLSRIRNRRPEGMALEAGTAEQASTVQAQPKPIKPSRFMEVLPAPQQPVAQPVVQATPQPQTPLQTPSNAVLSPQTTTPSMNERDIVINATNSLLDGDMDLDLPEAYMLSLGFVYGIPKPTTDMNMQSLPPIS
jgi:hypothetical protein